MSNLEKLIQRHKITSIALPGAPVNKTFKDSDGWTVTLSAVQYSQGRYEWKNYTVPFYMGKGHKGKPPKTADVLSCLLVDASCAPYNFEDFCSEFGYDTDSRTAERIWKGCQKTHGKLQQFLGKHFEEFIENNDY